MTVETQDIEVWFAINSDGDVDFNFDCAEDAANNVGGIVRVFHLKLTVPLPVVPTLTATLPDTDAPLTLKVE